jgi:hypothetical protein
MNIASYKDNKEINIYRKTYEEAQPASAAGPIQKKQFNPYCNNEGTTLGMYFIVPIMGAPAH